MLLAAPVWHFWIGVALFIPILLMAAAMLAMYLNKVHRPRYPKSGQERS